MRRLLTVLVTSLASVSVLTFASGAQRHPDLSGDWVLVSGTSTDLSRTGGQATTVGARGERPTTSTTISGAAFNCGRGCTIVHKGQALTIDKAQLAGKRPAPPPTVTLQIDGRRAPVVDAVNPGRELPTTAQWKGDTLEIATADSHQTTQRLSLDGNQLVVVTSVNITGTGTLTFKYVKH